MSASFVAAVRNDEASRCYLVHIRCLTFSGTDLTWVLAWRHILEEEPYERFPDVRREVIHVLKPLKEASTPRTSWRVSSCEVFETIA